MVDELAFPRTAKYDERWIRKTALGENPQEFAAARTKTDEEGVFLTAASNAISD